MECLTYPSTTIEYNLCTFFSLSTQSSKTHSISTSWPKTINSRMILRTIDSMRMETCTRKKRGLKDRSQYPSIDLFILIGCVHRIFVLSFVCVFNIYFFSYDFPINRFRYLVLNICVNLRICNDIFDIGQN